MERYIHTYIHTYRQSDMAFFFLRMRLLASPFGLAIIVDLTKSDLVEDAGARRLVA